MPVSSVTDISMVREFSEPYVPVDVMVTEYGPACPSGTDFILRMLPSISK